jgi:hypothetical protein
LTDLPSNGLLPRLTCINKCILICDVVPGEVDGVLYGHIRDALATLVYTIHLVMTLGLCLSVNTRLG